MAGEGISSDPEKQALPASAGKRGCGHLRALSYASVFYQVEEACLGAAFKRSVGREVMAPFESPYLFSFWKPSGWQAW